jgi:general secretion pathway protein C
MFFLESLKKYFWVGRILLVGLCAYLSANAVSIYVRGSLSQTPTLSLPAVAASSVAYKSLNDYDMILKRSLFNSAGVNMQASFTKKESGPAVTVEDMVLLGTIAGEPEISYAVINTKHDSKTEVYRMHDKVGGEAEVVAIRAREVELLRNGEKETIKLPELDDLKKAGDRWAKGAGKDIADGIRKLGDHDFVVSKELIDAAFKDMGKLMSGARLMPNFDGGKINGFKISHIQKDSLYKLIGLDDGDVLHRVNSKEINNPLDGLRVIQELQTAKNISIDFSRNGQRQTSSYTVR